MAFTNNPVNSVVDRLRLKVGDTDILDEGLSDEVYEYLYQANDSNENRAALEALKMLVFKYAKLVREEAGTVVAYENERYEHYKQMLDLVTKDPSFSFLLAGKAYAGGLTKEDRRMNPSSDPFRLGETTLKYPFEFPVGGRGWSNFPHLEDK